MPHKMKPRKGLWHWISIFSTGLSAVEWLWRVLTVLIIGGSWVGGTLIAKADPVLNKFGPILWVGVGAIVALVTSVILFLIKSSRLKEAEADLYRAMAVPRSTINPLSNSFTDSIIAIEDLRLPTRQLHENKLFNRCKFVGPAAIAIRGGTYDHCGFLDCGDIIALPEGVLLTGIIVFDNCTVKESEFIKTTIFVDQNTARSFAAVPGVRVMGLLS